MLRTNPADPCAELEAESPKEADGDREEEAEHERGSVALKGTASVVLVDVRKLGPETVAQRFDGGWDGRRGVKLVAVFVPFANFFLGVDISGESAAKGSSFPLAFIDFGSSTIQSKIGPQPSVKSLVRKNASKSCRKVSEILPSGSSGCMSTVLSFPEELDASNIGCLDLQGEDRTRTIPSPSNT